MTRQSPPSERPLPQSPEAEKAILGAMLLSPIHAGTTARNSLSGVEFYSSAHLIIFDCIGKLIDEGKTPDLIMVTQRLQDGGHLADVGGPAYLGELLEASPTTANVEHYIQIVQEKYLRRTLIGVGHDLIENSYESTKDIEEAHSEALGAIMGAAQTSTGIVSVATASMDGMKQYEEAVQSERHLLGLSTGFSDLDHFTRGLESEAAICIAARPSLGKTSLMLAIALYVATVEAKPVGIISLEQSAKALTMRMAASIAGVNIRHPKSLSAEDHQKVVDAVFKVKKLPIFIDDRPALRLNQIRATSRVMKSTHGCELLMLDHLQLTGRAPKQNELDHLSEVTGGIHQIAKELKLPFVFLSQLNRDLEKDNRLPRLSDLRSSGSIEQDSDVIMLLSAVTKEQRDKLPAKLKELPTEEGKLLVRMNLAKNREGDAGPWTNIYTAFEKEFTRFRNVKYPESTTEPETDWRSGPST